MPRRILPDPDTGLSLTSRDLADLVRDLDQVRDPDQAAGRAVRDPRLRGLVDLGPGQDLVDLAAPVDRVALEGLADLDTLDLADPVVLGLGAQVDPVDRAMADRADQVGRVDPHRSLTRPEAFTTGVAHKWAAPGMCRTASARPAMVHRLRRHSTDGAGMAGLRLERRRLGGTDRRLQVDGTGRRLPVVGTLHGTDRRAT